METQLTRNDITVATIAAIIAVKTKLERIGTRELGPRDLQEAILTELAIYESMAELMEQRFGNVPLSQEG